MNYKFNRDHWTLALSYQIIQPEELQFFISLNKSNFVSSQPIIPGMSQIFSTACIHRIGCASSQAADRYSYIDTIVTTYMQYSHAMSSGLSNIGKVEHLQGDMAHMFSQGSMGISRQSSSVYNYCKGQIKCFKILVTYFACVTECMILTICGIVVMVTLQYIILHVIVILNIVVAL